MDYQRLPSESSKAFAAFCYYCDLGPAERSLEKVRQKYGKSTVRVYERWSSQWHWVERVRAYDDVNEQIKEEARQSEIKKIMSEGYAQTHERVRGLNNLAVELEEMLTKKDNIWLQEPKVIGFGETATLIHLIKFNAPLIERFQSVLDDLAKETGGRVKHTKQELSGNILAEFVNIDVEKI